MYATLSIIILTSLVSILCFTGTAPADKLAFEAYDVPFSKVAGHTGQILLNQHTY